MVSATQIGNFTVKARCFQQVSRFMVCNFSMFHVGNFSLQSSFMSTRESFRYKKKQTFHGIYMAYAHFCEDNRRFSLVIKHAPKEPTNSSAASLPTWDFGRQKHVMKNDFLPTSIISNLWGKCEKLQAIHRNWFCPEIHAWSTRSVTKLYFVEKPA